MEGVSWVVVVMLRVVLVRERSMMCDVTCHGSGGIMNVVRLRLGLRAAVGYDEC